MEFLVRIWEDERDPSYLVLVTTRDVKILFVDDDDDSEGGGGNDDRQSIDLDERVIKSTDMKTRRDYTRGV